MRQRVGPVDLDGAAKQCDRLIVSAKSHLGGAREMQPQPSKAVARRESQGLVFMGCSFFRMTDKNLGETDVPLSGGQVRIERQRPLEFGNALVGAMGLVQDASHDLMG